MGQDLEPAASAVLAADDRRRVAMLAGDVAALERLLTPDFTYIHTTGFRDAREAYLAPLRKGAVEYLKAERLAADVRVYGDWALVDGEALVVVRAPPGDGSLYPMHTLYLAAWVLKEGEWRLSAYASTIAQER